MWRMSGETSLVYRKSMLQACHKHACKFVTSLWCSKNVRYALFNNHKLGNVGSSRFAGWMFA